MDREKRIILIAIIAAVALGISINASNSKRQSATTDASENPTITSTESPSSQSPTSQGSATSPSKSTVPTSGLTQTLSLSITSPANRSTVTTSTITISGKTSSNAEIFINDKTLKADGSGNFSTSITLDEGENLIAISANDANGNFVEKELTVTYQP